MPGFDGTGPMGMGVMTGGGRGFCAVSVDTDRGYVLRSRGFSRKGFGRGCRNRAYYAGAFPVNIQNRDEERSLLKEQEALLQTDLAEVQARLKDLENK